MPEVSFIGEAETVHVKCSYVSVSWAIVPGSAAWNLYAGLSDGESQTCAVSSEIGYATLNHPIDSSFQTSSIEGWPFLVCEVWDKSEEGIRSFVGCGSAWLPPSHGAHSIDVFLWRPCAFGLENLSR